MSAPALAPVPGSHPKDRLDELFDELAELAGQRNAIDGRIVDIVAEIDHAGLGGMTGARSIPALVAWKLGITPRNAETIAAVAARTDEFPQCTTALREGRLSLDQVGVIADKAAEGSDAHYAQLASVATVNQLRTAIKLAPRPKPDPKNPRERAITKTSDDGATTWKITLPHDEAATFDAALASHLDAAVAEWKRDHPDGETDQTPPMPRTIDAFLRLVTAGWDTDVAQRPHGQRTTVVVHVDADKPGAATHLGSHLPDSERQYLTCDADCEIWLHRHGQAIGSGRSTRTINRRLRRALEYRQPTCAVPGCGATRGLHAHHIIHWENGGPTELHNLILVCPYHHRAHHRGLITITGTPDHLVITDDDGDPLHPGSLARPPTTPPPDVPPCPGPTGERADWWWYTPFEPEAPPSPN